MSGIVDGAHESRLLRADGKVMGAVSEDILVEIPLEDVFEGFTGSFPENWKNAVIIKKPEKLEDKQ